MKRLSIIVLLLAAPLATMAQFVVFSDNFTHGSTLNQNSVPSGTPFASATSYDVAASKNATTGPAVNSSGLQIVLNSPTSSGLGEVQAVFSKSPIALISPGDYINLTYTFRMTNGLPAGAVTAYLGQGLYNSSGLPPVAGGLANAGLGATAGSPFATGNCAEWQGYFSRVFATTNILLTRVIQSGGAQTMSGNQDLLGNGVTGGFSNLPPVNLGQNITSAVTLTNGSYYTISYTILLADTNTPTLAFTNILYNGAGTNGSIASTASATATGTNYLTNSFDGLSFGRRDAASILITMVITNITVTANISTFPGQPFDVTGGGVGCVGSSSFPVGLDGSVANNDYYLYTNGVWTGVFQSGTGSALNLLTENVVAGSLTNTVVASNTISGATGQMLGSALVAAEAPPSITNQPSPQIVANGSIGVFNVGASGGGLTYQWYKNSLANPLSNGGNITGATNSSLVISPAGAGDAASYFAVVTSGCNATAQSSPASLTIGAPASITWQGNNPNSNWDLSTTANFINGGAVVFHNGDNVSFDNSAATFTVNVTGNFIAPGSMTDSAGIAYTFNGPGVIQGPGSLVLNGGGRLTINNSNAYTGGTTISSGTLVLSNGVFFPVGTGPITLAGGTLDIPIKGNSAVGLSNNINVTASSTLQFEQTATFACVLNGAITGNSGTILTINAAESSAIATARLRMYSAFTNNSDIVLLSGGGQAQIEFAPYLPATNSSGAPLFQVFNGIISGGGGHIVPRGAGTVILNNTNTFNDSSANNTNPVLGVSLLMSSGNVGFGADSVQSSPPTIDSSPAGTGLIAINVGTEGGNCSFQATGGSHTIANQLIYTSATNVETVIFGGANNLTFSGEFDLANPNTNFVSLPVGAANDVNGTNRTLDVTNTAATTFSGVISDNGNASGITKTGNGSLYLNGTNIYTGPTTNNSGLLAGSGSIAGPVIIGTNGSSASIGGGSAASIGTLTVSNSLTLNANVSIRVNKSLAQSNDLIVVTGSLANTAAGIVFVNNLGSALVAGDRFQIFNKAVSGGGSLGVNGPAGVTWNNNLASDGSISVQSVGPAGPSTNATILKVSLSGTNVLIHGTNNNVPNTSFHFQALTTTNLSTPLSNWTAGATLPFNANGTFDYTNPIVPGTPRQFIDIKAVP
jgi:autotransporter-associated beta strand protein